MCIIVDADKLGSFLGRADDSDWAPIHNWLRGRGGTIVYSTGGKFAGELGGKARKILAAFDQAGMARNVPAVSFQDGELELQTRVRSNDAHVLALARFSGARLLCTADKNLIEDFKDKRFLDHPRGKVYTRSDNIDLLTKSACAPKGQR